MCSFAPFAGVGPTVVTVPGLGGSGEGHWQTLWERSRPSTIRAELGMWDAPQRNSWVTRLDRAIGRVEAPVILAAHSLGCLAVAWWAQLLPQPHGWPVAGALLVAPADVDRPDAPGVLRGFAPAPAVPLPFSSIVVGSTDDPWMAVERARSLAAGWGSRFVEAGPIGHINADSGIGAWPEGRTLLERLVADAPMFSPPSASLAPAGARRAA